MNRIIGYTIVVTGDGVADMEAEVNAKIADGWQPHGSPFQGGEGMSWLMQALVKFKD